MKKLLATLTTVAMLATTTSAFAADPIANDAGFDKAAGTYSIASDLSKVEGQLTLLIIPEEAYLSTTGIADEDILYIDQGKYSSTLFKSVGILGGKELKAGDYYVKIGGTGLNGIIVEKFTVVAEEEGTKITVKWGDITGDKAIDSSDAIAALMNFAGYSRTYTVEGYEVPAGSDFGGYKWGDITGDKVIDSSDAIAALMNFAGYSRTYTVNGVEIVAGSDVVIEIK